MSEPRTGRAAGLMFVLVWLSCAWFGSWEWNPNNVVRLFAAIEIVENGSAEIDRYAAMTMDKAQFGEHFYSDKAPGMTLMSLPAIVLVDAATGVRARDMSISLYDEASARFVRARLRAASATSSATLTAIGAVLVLVMATTLGGSPGAGVFAGLAFALGTPMWGWAGTIFGHASVAGLFVVAIWAAWRGTREARPSLPHAAILGAALGWSVVVEFSAALTGFAIGLYALWQLRRYARADALRAIVAAAVPAAIAGAILLGYNLFAFGAPFRLGYQGVVGFEGMHEGLFGLTYPRPDRLWELTLGTKRGLLWCAPVVVVALAGLVRLVLAAETRALGVMAIGGAVTVLLYNAAYAYWDGGNSTGPRHLIPALAYLALGFGPAWTWMRSVAWRGALAALLVLSVAINLVIASAEIATGGRDDFPLWTDVFAGRFLGGQLRTFPSEWLGWTPWSGLALYLAIASVLGIALLSGVRKPR